MKNNISYFGTQFLIFYISKIKFNKYRLRGKYQKEVTRSFNNLIFQNNSKCLEQNENRLIERLINIS